MINAQQSEARSASPQPLLVGKKEAADMLAVSVKTLEKVISRGGIPVIKIGARTLIRYADLVEYCSR